MSRPVAPLTLTLALTLTLTTTLMLAPDALRQAHAEGAVSTPFILVSDVSVVEGDQGEVAFTASVRMTGWYGPATVDVAAVPGTAEAADYNVPPARLTLTPGGAAVTVQGTVRGDLDYEGEEWFQVQAVAAPGSYPGWVSSSGGRVTIRDDDEARASRLAVMGATVMEGGPGTTRTEVEVLLAPAASHPVSVDYSVSAQPAGGTGTLSFAPGQTRQVIAVDVVGDNHWEMDERITVRLHNPRRALVTTAEAVVLVRNDDAPSVVQLDDVTVTEGNGPARLVTLSFRYDRPTPPQTKLWVTTEAGLAAPGRDFKALNETLYPPAGVTTFVAELLVVGDAIAECDEGLTIRYAGVYTGDETRRSARVLIQDDDGPPPAAGPCPDPFVPDPSAPPPVAEPPVAEPPAADPPRAELPVDGGVPANDAAAGGGNTGGTGGGLADSGGGCSLGRGDAGAGAVAVVALALLALVFLRRTPRPNRGR
jgi:hypothetical protein